MVQIFGTKKCKDTQKALRFFKERRIQIQFVDLTQRGMSKGELRNVARSVPLEELINPEDPTYEKQQLKYLQHDIEEKLLEFPLLLKTPVVRNGQKATAGHQPNVWKAWVKGGL